MEVFFIAIIFICYICNLYFNIYKRIKLNQIFKKIFDKKLKIISFELSYKPFPFFLFPNGNYTLVLFDKEDNEYFPIHINKEDTWETIVDKITQKREEKNIFVKKSNTIYIKIKDKLDDDFFVNFYISNVDEIKYEVRIFTNEKKLKNAQLCKNYQFIKEFVKSNEDMVFKIYSKNKNKLFENQIKKGYFGICEKVGSLILYNEKIYSDDYLYQIKNEKYYINKNLSYFENNSFFNNEKIYLEVGIGLKILVKEKFKINLFDDKFLNMKTFLSKNNKKMFLECYIPLEDFKVEKIVFNLKKTTFEMQDLDFN